MEKEIDDWGDLVARCKILLHLYLAKKEMGKTKVSLAASNGMPINPPIKELWLTELQTTITQWIKR